MGKFVHAAFAAFALAGCASMPMPRATPIPTGAPAPPPGPSIFETAPHAHVQTELRVCSISGSNLGPIGQRHQSLVYTPYIDTVAGELLRDPTDAVCLSSGFGFRSLASTGGSDHTGIDLANADGGWIFAAGDGWIVSENYRGGYGLVLEIDHGRGVHTLYAHLNEIDPTLRPGQFVQSGQAVARMGRTGNATGVHLHYEIIVDGVKEDPLTYGSPFWQDPGLATPVAPSQVTEVGQPAPADNTLSPADATPRCNVNAAYDPNAPCTSDDNAQAPQN
jgi:hypothetical protein